jgi:hypothetical protein
MRTRSLALLLSIPLLCAGCSAPSSAQDAWNGLVSAFDTVKQVGVSVDTAAKQHTLIVPGYGAPVAGNDTYEQYIQSVADYVNDTANDVDAVVFTGSYTSREDLSEAEAMNSYFNSIVDTDALLARGVRVYKEECAIAGSY